MSNHRHAPLLATRGRSDNLSLVNSCNKCLRFPYVTAILRGSSDS